MRTIATSFTALIFSFTLLSVDCHSQFVYVRNTNNNSTSYYPALKKEGNKWNVNLKEEAKPNWGQGTYPFFINDEGELFDGQQEKFGWYIGDNFYLMTGWVVLNNEKEYYKNKELIYSESEIVFRVCSGQKLWIVPLGDDKTYKLLTEDKINGGQKYLFDLVLSDIKMDKVTAVAIFQMIKIFLNDTAPCGYGAEDDRGELTNKIPETEQEKSARELKESMEKYDRLKEQWAREDRIKDSIRQAEATEEKQYTEMLIRLKETPLSAEELEFTGRWEFVSGNLNPPTDIWSLTYFEYITINKDRSFEYKSYFYFYKPYYDGVKKDYYECTGTWEIKDNVLHTYIANKNYYHVERAIPGESKNTLRIAREEKRNAAIAFDELSSKKAIRSVNFYRNGPVVQLKGKKISK